MTVIEFPVAGLSGFFTTSVPSEPVTVSSAAKGTPGTLLAASAEGVEVACAEGSLKLLMLQPEGKRAMTAQEFLSGRKLVLGGAPFS